MQQGDWTSGLAKTSHWRPNVGPRSSTRCSRHRSRAEFANQVRSRPVLSDLNEESDSTLESNYVPVRRSDQENSFSVSTIVRGSNYAEYDELPVPVQRKLDEDMPVQRKLNEFLMPVQRKLDEDCVLVQHEDDGRCKSEPDSTSAGVIDTISNSTSTPDPVGGRQTSSSVSCEAVPPAQFAASNIFQLEVEPEFEDELPCSTPTRIKYYKIKVEKWLILATEGTASPLR